MEESIRRWGNATSTQPDASTILRMGPLPPPSPLAYLERRAQEKRRKAAKLLIAAAVFHVLSIPVALLFLITYASSIAGRSISLEEMFALGQGLGALILFGSLIQVVLAAIAGIGAELLAKRRTRVSMQMITAGAAAVVLSLVIFGGFMGWIGGALSVTAGIMARPRPSPATWPPAYSPPMSP